MEFLTNLPPGPCEVHHFVVSSLAQVPGSEGDGGRLAFRPGQLVGKAANQLIELVPAEHGRVDRIHPLGRRSRDPAPSETAVVIAD